MRSFFLSIALSPLLVACKAPPEAPDDLNELARYLYREWGHEDPVVMQQGIKQLESFLDSVESLDRDTKSGLRSWDMDPPTEDDVGAVDRPDEMLATDMLGVSVGYASPWPLHDHVRLQRESDQTPAEPTAKEYLREITDGDCFEGNTCSVMATVNHLRRSNVSIKISFVLFKDFRWVQLDDDRRAVISRSWTDQVWWGDGENSAIYQSNSLDVWIEQPDDTTWRWQNVWSQSKTPAEDGLVKGTLKWATNGIFMAGDDAIEDMYYSEE